MTRTTVTSVSFARPFSLSGIEGMQPAGTYAVETEEELLQGLSFPVYRRVQTTLVLPAPPRSMILAQGVTVDPTELDALVRESNAELTACARSAGERDDIEPPRHSLPHAESTKRRIVVT